MYLHTIELHRPVGNQMHRAHAAMLETTDQLPLPPFVASAQGSTLLFITEGEQPIYSGRIGLHHQRYFELRQGEEHDFFIVINNARRKTVRLGEKRRTEFRERTVQETYEYLERLGEEHGFCLLSADQIVPTVHRIGHKGGGRQLTAEVSGRLLITDLVKFRQAVTRGIGQKRTYGIGMLILSGMYAAEEK